ncbi:hypothetical protein GCM10007047_23590 [Cerasicoccus arenae]|uniref:Sugar ABC transporter substrate-binding protein n=1 Tax=Cerasicoccus arenae TaxID=424488 RepID=A0A8J3DBE9_9BACT|nr:hypothetical protein GCM10007047_23590 [Cerasicoccus arenae]
MLVIFALVGLPTGFAQPETLPTAPGTNIVGTNNAGSPVAEPVPDAYLPPAPPIDQNDSHDAMTLLDNKKQIKVGDQLEYMVVEDREPPEVLLVDEDGQIEIPLLGKMPADSHTAQDLAFTISEALKKEHYYQATVLISEHQAANRRGIVLVMGEVQREGVVEIPSGDILRVSDAIMRAGGFNLYADPTRVSMIRPNAQNPESSQRFDINVGQILETGRLDQDLILRANDRIFVGRRGDSSGQYTLSGAVRSPGVYPISIGQKITLSEAILISGGFTEFGDGSDVTLMRYGEDGSRTEREINVNEILEKGRQDNDVLLQPGDRIIVDEKWVTF